MQSSALEYQAKPRIASKQLLPDVRNSRIVGNLKIRQWMLQRFISIFYGAKKPILIATNLMSHPTPQLPKLICKNSKQIRINLNHSKASLATVGPLSTYLTLLPSSVTANLQSSTLKKVKMTITSFRTKINTLMKTVKLHSPASRFLYPPQVNDQQTIQMRSIRRKTAMRYQILVFCLTQALSQRSMMKAKRGRFQSGRQKQLNRLSTVTAMNSLLMCSIVLFIYYIQRQPFLAAIYSLQLSAWSTL